MLMCNSSTGTAISALPKDGCSYARIKIRYVALNFGDAIAIHEPHESLVPYATVVHYVHAAMRKCGSKAVVGSTDSMAVGMDSHVFLESHGYKVCLTSIRKRNWWMTKRGSCVSYMREMASRSCQIFLIL